MNMTQDIADQLAELPPGSAAALKVHPDAYFHVIKSMDVLSRNKDIYVIYITSTLPSSSILSVLKMLDIDTDRMYFVDAISRIMTGRVMKSDRIIYVESPTMLENIMLKVEFLSRHDDISKKGAVVVLDSINSMAIHNNPRILSEFLHIFVNSLRGKEFYTAIMAIEEPGSEEIVNLVNFVCDANVIIGEPEEM